MRDELETSGLTLTRMSLPEIMTGLTMSLTPTFSNRVAMLALLPVMVRDRTGTFSPVVMLPLAPRRITRLGDDKMRACPFSCR